jgi:hypothetical protein
VSRMAAAISSITCGSGKRHYLSVSVSPSHRAVGSSKMMTL